ncbi:sulfite exporter TauE/SafE family protein [Oceanobacillus jeddahense]|uniref:Probable membrane transporter protein n=1 Tax=Oceanobacillus jeddahense TaxID=1462527 RepID=A0ABY5JQ63_9BACI|nr:sulfite exporter TauE/SafE family protein [Oceanobacillus jeddahense]UUI02430.1 sulfite exporter TauE/SafE family protein [Oceanobacillus jeddahense]
MVTIIAIYLLISLLASILGAMAGLGGGIIIKPLLDFLGQDDLATLGILSASTVLAMSCVSLINFRNATIQLNRKNSFLIAVGSILGGFIGKGIFNYLVISNDWNEGVGIFQSCLLAIILIFIYIFIKCKHRIRTLQVSSNMIIIMAGIILGIFSSFLGIGGGPLNVAVLILLFSMDAKNAGVNSIFIIFFSQIASLFLVGVLNGFDGLEAPTLLFMISGGVLGGFIGSNIAQKLTSEKIQVIFNGTILVIILINIYNAVMQI